MASAAFQTEMARLQDAKPRIKVEHISPLGVTTDITAYYVSGASFEQIKERAPDEISAGDFDIILNNHDDYFSEFVATSLFYNVTYHGGKIKISQGFILSDGSIEYETQAVGFIDELVANESESTVMLRCRDFIRRILDETLHSRPSGEVASAGAGNLGNGMITTIETKPFKTVTENWTLTCTTAGGDGTAIFDVVGSVSGDVGNATSGTEFSTANGVGGIKFTIFVGTSNWAVGDAFTFSTKQYPEWNLINAGKIIWSILTGYNWDSDTQEAWSSFVFDLDHTKSTANTDINYTSFVNVIGVLDVLGKFNLRGYVAYDENAVDFLQDILLLFLGSLYTDGDGKIKISSYMPVFSTGSSATFTDALKITKLGYSRTVDEVINYIVVNYKKYNQWEFSDEDVDHQGVYVLTDADSIDDFGILSVGFGVRWFTTLGTHVSDFSQKLIDKYAEPPLNIDFETGLDALLTDIGDVVTVTDTKYNISTTGEVAKVKKDFDTNPVKLWLRVRRDLSFTSNWAFLGSSADESDGMSPQASNYDSATSNDKLFAYLSQTGGGGGVDYRMF